jgi:hypothetical protein
MNDALYRDTLEPVRRQVAAQIAARHRELADAAALGRLHAARVGRGAGGAAMVATMLVGWPLLAVLGPALDLNVWGGSHHAVPGESGVLTLVLLSSWGVGLLAWQLARPLARWRFDQWLAAMPKGLDACAADPDPLRALAWLDVTPSPARAVHRRIDRWQTAALALPMVGCSLAAPLTLHFLFVLACAAVQGPWQESGFSFADVRSFDDWIAISALVVGHAHLVLACHAVLSARSLRRLPADAPPSEWAGWRALMWTVVASAVPGIVAYLIPPVLTFFTGLVFIPLMYGAARRTFARERAELARDPS